MAKSKRKAGVLMPVSALPGCGGIGSLGKNAYKFVDWLTAAGAKTWQILPLLPLSYGDSPYQACVSNGLNYYFIDPETLKSKGLLKKSDYCEADFCIDKRRVNYGLMFKNRTKMLKKAFSRFDRTNKEWLDFLSAGEYDDFALFMTLKEKFNFTEWTAWGEFSVYNEKKVKKFIAENREKMEFWQFTQYEFLNEWKALKSYANSCGIEIMGDMPIYVAFDSVEVWKYGKKLFMLDDDNRPKLVAGVPPDAFSATGQLWGNPVYDWEKMRKNGFSWWRKRIKDALKLYDIVRIDHFRGLDRFFAIPYGAADAKNGVWLDGPKKDLFKGMKNKKIVAEDLGIIDDGVLKLMADTGYPGMRVLQFGFNMDEQNPHKPSNYIKNTVAYTGTHDNEPIAAFIKKINTENPELFGNVLNFECKKANVKIKAKTVKDLGYTAIELLFSSVADTAIIPFADVILAGEEARINEPSVFSEKNWSYRFLNSEISEKTAEKLRTLIKKTGRL